MDEYITKLCDEKHNTIDEKLADHEQRLNNHSGRLDTLEGDNRELKAEMKNVCEKIQDLIGTIKWGLGIFTTMALFALGYLIQRG